MKASKRVERGQLLLPGCRGFGISRKILHDWIEAWNADGPDGLNRKPRPKPRPQAQAASDVRRQALRPRARQACSNELQPGAAAGPAIGYRQFVSRLSA
ncbi:helix-turn-helix domain-containing protein [Bradyrhizobium manausense]|uniref:helix-turn-helix domain-containing protein n=1 Tax=Bradyrhizobium manausense TaxID=989370 RepID=UPI003221DA9C